MKANKVGSETSVLFCVPKSLLRDGQPSTVLKGRSCNQNLAPVVVILWHSLVFSRKMIASTNSYRCPDAPAPVVVKKVSLPTNRGRVAFCHHQLDNSLAELCVHCHDCSDLPLLVDCRWLVSRHLRGHRIVRCGWPVSGPGKELFKSLDQ